MAWLSALLSCSALHPIPTSPGSVGASIVATRFLLGRGGATAVASARIEMFLAVTLPLMVAQRDQRFVWLVLHDETLQPQHAAAVYRALAPYRNMRLAPISQKLQRTHFDTELLGDGSWNAFAAQHPNLDRLLLTQLDSDDGLHETYMASLHAWFAGAELPSSRNWAWACANAAVEWFS
jgi:hypothetical protein